MRQRLGIPFIHATGRSSALLPRVALLRAAGLVAVGAALSSAVVVARAEARDCAPLRVVISTRTSPQIARRLGVRVLYVYDRAGLFGFAARLTSADVRVLRGRLGRLVVRPDRSRYFIRVRPGYEKGSPTAIPECPEAPTAFMQTLGEAYDFFPHWLGGPSGAACRDFWATLSARQLFRVARHEAIERLSPTTLK